jgi:hypothetical protein
MAVGQGLRRSSVERSADCGFRLVASSGNLLAPGAVGRLQLALGLLASLQRAPVEKGASLNGERSVVDVTYHMGLRFQNDITAMNRAFNLPVHNYPLGGDTPADMGASCDHEGGTVQFAINSSVDFD